MGILKLIKKLGKIDDPIVRDFTEDAEEDMVKIANDVAESDWDLFSKYVTDPFGRWLDKHGYLDVLVGVDKYQKSVIDYYNYSAKNIRDICSQMRKYDRLYGQRVANYAKQGDNVHRLTQALAECLDVNSSEYTPDNPISNRLVWFRNHWVTDINGELIKISDLDSDAEKKYRDELDRINISEEEIVDFCNDEDSVTIFEEYTDYIFDEEVDWNALDIVFLSTGSVIYKGVEYTIDELLAILTKEGYNEKIVREELNKLISSVISGENCHQTFMKDHDEAKEYMEDLIKDYLKDKNKKSKFKTFVENMGGITYVKQLFESCPQLLDYLFSDYTRGLEIIENIERTCERAGTEAMREAIIRLKQDYNSKWVGLFNKSMDFNVDMIEDLTKKGIEDWIKEEIGESSVILTVLDIADVESKVDGAHKLIALKQITYQLQDAYEDAIEVIKSGDYTEEDLTYAKNMFDMLKETTKSVYSTYRDMCKDDPSKQIWCNQQIQKIENMPMNGYNDPYTFEKN